MPTVPARRAPLWFVGLVAVAAALVCRDVLTHVDTGRCGSDVDAPPALAFWGIFLIIAEALWKGVEVAGRVALAILQYSVHILWRAVVLITKGASELGKFAWKGLRQAWGLLRATYDHVLKPAWKFVWKWVDKTERWLQRTFGPLVKFLRRVRKWVLDFYADYIRPILDIIDISRRALRVLASFGVAWARALDRRLGEIQDAIDRPFRALLAKLNEVINLVNRVVTADGLFQKLAHVRSVERDITQIVNTWHAAHSKPPTDAEWEAALARDNYKTGEQVISETREYLRSGDGPHASSIDEWSAQLARNLGVR